MTMVFADILGDLFRVPGLIFTVGGILGIVGIVAGTIAGVSSRKAREETKRELAAYVAEGTIEADKAIEMLKAGEDAD